MLRHLNLKRRWQPVLDGSWVLDVAGGSQRRACDSGFVGSGFPRTWVLAAVLAVATRLSIIDGNLKPYCVAF